MVAITFKAFRTAIPRALDRLLDPNQARTALNCKLTSGRIDSLMSPSTVSILTNNIRTMFRYRIFRNEAWMENWLTWEYPVDLVMSPLSNDQEGRFYFVGSDIEPRMSTFALAIDAAEPYPAAWYALGVTSPTTAPSVAVAGGSSTTESRSYVYTYVTALGEESSPSPASTLVTGYINGTWNVTAMQTAQPNSGTISAATYSALTGRVTVTLNDVFGLSQYDTLTLAGVVGMTDLNGSRRIMSIDTATKKIEVVLETAQTYTSGGTWTRNAPHNLTGMTKRLYRTNGDATAFFFVAGDIPVATTSYADTVLGTDLGETLPTTYTLVPPKNMYSMVSLPNGCLAGIAGNELCFSDPYLPYSWPLGNRYSFSGNGVSLVAMGNSVLVLTDSYPIMFSGSDPEAMSPTTAQTYSPCVAKQGVVSTGGACLYPSYDGLWMLSPGGAQNITKKLYRAEDWSALGPETFRAEFFDGKYFASKVSGTVRDMLIIDVSEPDGIVVSDVDCDAIYRGDITGALYIAKGDTIYQWDHSDVPLLSEWRSATVQLPKPVNFSIAQIHANFSALLSPNTSIEAGNEAIIFAGTYSGSINDDELLAYEINGSEIQYVDSIVGRIQLTLYGNEIPVYSKEVTNQSPFRLPAGFMHDTFGIGVTTNIGVYSVSVATSSAELAQTA